MKSEHLNTFNPELAEFSYVMRENFEDSFTDQSLELVGKILYLDSVATFDSESGLAIYEGIDGFIYSVLYGDSATMTNNVVYSPQRITSEQAIQLMIEMQNTINNEAF